MVRRVVILAAFILVFVAGFLLNGRLTSVSGQAPAGLPAGVVVQKGGQEQFGHYEPVPNWPKPLTQVPGHEKWTWGAHQGIFAQNPNRVFVIQRGELPDLRRPRNTPVPSFGPSLSFPVNQVPFRNASQGPVASPPTGGGTGGVPNWGNDAGKEGVDYRWEHLVYVVDAQGNVNFENWPQWDKAMMRPHSVYINPYDPEKHVWIVDDGRHTVLKFTNDGSKLVQTIGTQDVPGSDGAHFNRPTFLTWLPDSTLFVADGYNGTRVAKFDKDGKFLATWGQKGDGGKETRPSYFNSVHGIATDPKTRRVYVNDRENKRIQVFDENGKFLDQWWIGVGAAHVYSVYMASDGYFWGSDAGTFQFVKWDLNGKYQYSFGFLGDSLGAIFAVHQMSVDQEGNLYTAETAGGRAQKFRPLRGADPAKLVGKPVIGAWRD